MSRATARKPPALVNESALDRARHGERVIVRRGGNPVAVVVSIADLRLLKELEDRYDVSVSLARLANPKEKRIPYAEVRKRAGLQGVAYRLEFLSSTQAPGTPADSVHRSTVR